MLTVLITSPKQAMFTFMTTSDQLHFTNVSITLDENRNDLPIPTICNPMGIYSLKGVFN